MAHSGIPERVTTLCLASPCPWGMYARGKKCVIRRTRNISQTGNLLLWMHPSKSQMSTRLAKRMKPIPHGNHMCMCALKAYHKECVLSYTSKAGLQSSMAPSSCPSTEKKATASERSRREHPSHVSVLFSRPLCCGAIRALTVVGSSGRREMPRTLTVRTIPGGRVKPHEYDR